MSKPWKFVLVFSLTAALVLAPAPADSQDVATLVAQGRFDDAIAMRGGTPPSEVEQALFLEGYVRGYQQKDYEYFVAALAAAKTLPGLSAGTVQKLDFWHGFTGYQMALRVAGAQTIEAARISVPMLEKARALLVASGEYASANNINLAAILEAADRYAEVLRSEIARGR
jgi:hypothetical protein